MAVKDLAFESEARTALLAGVGKTCRRGTIHTRTPRPQRYY